MGKLWKKFSLLLWKNFTLQKRHTVGTIVEIGVPVFFTLILVLVRGLVDWTVVKEDTKYPPFLPADFINDQPPFIFATPRELLYTPDSGDIKTLMQGLEPIMMAINHSVVGYQNEEALLEDYTKKTQNRKATHNPVLAAVIFKTDDIQDKIDYVIRFPASAHDGNVSTTQKIGFKPRWFTEFLYELFQLPRDRDAVAVGSKEKNPFVTFSNSRGGQPGYWKEGFLFLQSRIDIEIVKFKANQLNNVTLSDKDLPEIQLNRYPYPSYTDDIFILVLQTNFPIFLMLSVIYSMIQISRNVSYEKEKRLKEAMRIMGLPNWLHWTAWFIKSFSILLVSTCILTLLYKVPFYGAGSGILRYTDASLLFTFFLLYAFTTIMFGFLVSSFCSSANTAATAAGVIFFLSYFPYFFLRPRYETLSAFEKIVWSCVSNSGMAFGCQLLSMFEGTGAGAQWSTITEGATPDDNISLLDIFIMLLFDAFLYLILAIYIEAVLPGEYGIPLPWYFPVTGWYWMGTPRPVSTGAKVNPDDAATESNNQKNPHVFEKEPTGQAGIMIKGLTKKFGKKVVVNNLHLNFYENQVTALLGHNGAGKTTTMSILTGLIPPTSGTAVVNGFDIRSEIDSVRGSLGLCPQYDILFEELTVEEHLRFFCLLKGVDKQFLDAEIDRMLGVIMLEPKRLAQVSTLSGGMKRKLSVGIALIGGSKVVLLDEPTGAMDPGARRNTWDLITSEKQGRTIVLSTHFMDEADLLGDRIAIMADGQAQCCGSSLFLKKKYGGGYHLIIVKEPSCKVDQVTALLQKRIPEVHVDQNIGSELSYSLPDEKSSLFPDMFEELEKRKDELGITSYGCSITEMEEVFMRVGEQVEAEMNAQNQNGNDKKSHEPLTAAHSKKPNLPAGANADGKNDSENPDKNGSENPENNVSANNEEGVNAAGATGGEERPLQVEVANVTENGRNTGCLLLIQQFYAMLVKKWLYSSRNWILVIMQTFVPVIFLLIALIMLQTLPDIANPKERKISLEHYSLSGKPTTIVGCENVVEVAEICESFEHVAERTSNVDKITKDVEKYILEKSHENLPRVNFRYLVAADILQGPRNDSSGNTFTGTIVKGFFNNQPLHVPPLILNMITNAILVNITGNKKMIISVANHPLPFTTRDKVENLGETEYEGFIVGFTVSFGLSFLSASFVVFIIKERETKSKHLQYVSGVKFPIFWLAHYLFDSINYVIPILALTITLAAFQTDDFKHAEMLGLFVLIMLFYGWGTIPLMYCSSFLFTLPSTGYTRMTFLNFFTGLASFLIVCILSIETLNLVDIARILEWPFLLFPNFDVARAVNLLAINRQLNEACPKFSEEILKSICDVKPEFNCCGVKNWPRGYLRWNFPGIGRHLLSLFLFGDLCFILLLLIEMKIILKLKYLQEIKLLGQRKQVEAEKDVPPEDTDVAAENARIRDTDLQQLFQTENMILRDITKCFNGKFLAVNELCLGVKEGECFGLLGINGAGKTTTFKMLTGDIRITSGDAYICSHSVKLEVQKVQKVLGYCPQFDAIIPEYTGKETIRLFARLRGIPEGQIDRLVDLLGADLLFTQHMTKPCGTYSGGNKRKLSVAIALVGNPSTVMLDEPTNGMDPVARRHLWNTIIKVRESGSSVVLTSHSMEECEALCTRLAIMVDGKFRCLGSTQHLKNKFGEGYTLIVQLAAKEDSMMKGARTSLELGRRLSSLIGQPQQWEQDLQPLQSYITEAFPGCNLKEKHPQYVHYHIQHEDGVTWAKIFKKMEEAKTLFRLEAYSVGQTTLEQVFLSFTVGQPNKDD